MEEPRLRWGIIGGATNGSELGLWEIGTKGEAKRVGSAGGWGGGRAVQTIFEPGDWRGGYWRPMKGKLFKSRSNS